MNNKVLLVTNKAISYIGTKIFSFALSWFILQSTGSGLSFGVSLLVNYLPTIILSFIAGHISDKAKYPKWILVICDLLSASVCLLPILSFNIITMYLSIFFLSAISAVFNNVVDAHLPNLEGVRSSDDLKKLMSTMQFIVSFVNIASPALGGLLINFISIKTFALINLCSFLLSAFGECWLHYKTPQLGLDHIKAERKVKKQKLNFLTQLPHWNKLRTFLIGDALSNFFVSAGLSVALPLIITQVLKMTSLQYGIVTSSLAVGSLFSSLKNIKYPVKNDFNYPYLYVGAIGVNLLLLTAITPLRSCLNMEFIVILFSFIQFINGWLTVSINLKTVTTFQIHVDHTYRGKVLGIMTGLSYILIPISLLLAGLIAELYSFYILPFASGSLLLLMLGMLYLSSRTI